MHLHWSGRVELPQYVPFGPADMCFTNAQNYARTHGGRPVLCWLLGETDRGVTAVLHAVVEIDGALLEITRGNEGRSVVREPSRSVKSVADSVLSTGRTFQSIYDRDEREEARFIYDDAYQWNIDDGAPRHAARWAAEETVRQVFPANAQPFTF